MDGWRKRRKGRKSDDCNSDSISGRGVTREAPPIVSNSGFPEPAPAESDNGERCAKVIKAGPQGSRESAMALGC